MAEHKRPWFTATTTATDLEDLRLISQKDLAELLDITPNTLRSWEAAGKCPRAVIRTRRCTRYRVSEVRAWIEAGLKWPLETS